VGAAQKAASDRDWVSFTIDGKAGKSIRNERAQQVAQVEGTAGLVRFSQYSRK
jgi:hypothetical protein